MTAAAAATAAAGGATARERVVNAAVELFAQHGYDGTSVAQVITAAGVAKGGFYHHFSSKQELLYAVYGDLIARQLAAMQRIVAQHLEPADTLRALIIDLVESTAASSRQAMVFWREQNRLDDVRTAEYRRARRRYHDTVRNLIRAAQRDGSFRAVASADTVTFAIFGMVNELPLWYRPTGRKKPTQLGAELADLMLAALVPDGEPR